MWLRSLGLAASYFVVARLSLFLLMATAPGYAMAFWPAAGVAVALLLLWGLRVWPGVLLGSFLVNVIITFDADDAVFDTRDIANMARSLALPLAISGGAVLQAVVGALLVRRLVGFPDPLNREQVIAKLLLLAGPVSCCIGATIGVGSLSALDHIATDEVAYTWWTWWIGDTIGVFVATPLVLLWASSRQPGRLRRAVTVSVSTAILASLVVVLFIHTEESEKERVSNDFRFQSEVLTRALENRVDFVLQGLTRVHRFHGKNSNAADRERFARATQNLLDQRGSVQAVSWVPRIRAAERAEFERDAKFVIKQLGARDSVPSGEHAEYYPILYREPPNPDAFGVDVGNEADRREAMQRAALSGEPVASSPIRQLKEPQRKTILVFLPIYRDNVIPPESEARREAVSGYVIAVLHVDRLIEAAWRRFHRSEIDYSSGINFWLIDETAAPEKRLGIFRRAGRETPSGMPAPAEDFNGLQRTTEIDAAGRRWTLHFASTPEYFAAHRSLQAWGVLAGGMLWTGLLGAVLLVITGRAELVAGLVEERTGELAYANTAMKQEIEERKRMETELRHREESLRQSEAALEESRRFIQQIAEMTPSILYVYDIQRHCNIFVNRRLETFLGYAWEQEQGPNMATLLADVHPDDLPRAERADEQCQAADDGAVVETEYRVRHANGEWRWLNSRNTVFGRDGDGNPTQILGAAQDVTDRKRLEQEVLDIAASEQRRIGQELHDGTGQELTGLCMLVDNLADALQEASPEQARRALRIADGMRHALGEVRLLARGLIPVEVDAEGLMAALTELANRISDLHTVRCVFDCVEPVPLDDNHTATQLYRIAQEALTNALKHGHAANIQISLEARGPHITLKVADDGVGLPETDEIQEGIGLRIMRYRAGQIGANLTIRHGAHCGTVVTCTLYRGATLG